MLLLAHGIWRESLLFSPPAERQGGCGPGANDFRLAANRRKIRVDAEYITRSIWCSVSTPLKRSRKQRWLRRSLAAVILWLLIWYALPWCFPWPEELNTPPQPAAALTDRNGVPLRRLLDEELAARVRDAVFGLPELQREALILYEYEGLSLNEIAAVVEADVGAIKARLYRARESLKRVLRPYLNSSQQLNSGREIVTLKEA